MAVTMACCDPLSPYTRDAPGGPTETTTTQKRFAQQLRGVLRRINAAIKRGVEENDIFNVGENTDTLSVDEPGPFNTDDSTRKTVLFIVWLKEQLDSEFLDVVGPDRNQFIRKAYAAGLRNANGQLRDLDIAFTPEGVDEVIGRPFHQSALRELFTRTYEQLESLSNDVVDEVRNTLLEGFQAGKGPQEIGRSIRDRVDSVGKHRATMIARSEVMNAHSEGTLTRLDEVQEETPADTELTAAHGEWDAAMDSRTCNFCRALDGVQLSTDEMRGTTVNFLGQEYRLKPPAHPNGRCNIRIMIGGDTDGDLNERLPAEIDLLT